MNVNVEISIGEFFDKVTILEIKRERIQDADKLKNINNELDALNALLEQLPFSRDQVVDEVGELKAINEKLWVIEDDIRDKEAAKSFDQEFIELARSVYITNDRRSDVKRDIRSRTNSTDFQRKGAKTQSSQMLHVRLPLHGPTLINANDCWSDYCWWNKCKRYM